MPAKTGIEGCFRMDASGCWIWTKATTRGYGYVKRGGIQYGAHRYSWILHRGAIPDGMTVDHLCFQPLCVNPEHLRLLSLSENSANRREVNEHNCPSGHAFTPENTTYSSDRRWPGHRVRRCRTCIRERSRRRGQQRARAG